MRSTLLLLSLLSSLVSATPAPVYPGFKTVWSDGFEGSAGATPNRDRWNIITDVRTNGEIQTYSTSNRNLQISGGGTVQLVPLKSKSGKWTSARIETKASFTPNRGKVTMFEAAIRFGDNPAALRQGLWPAFWMLGDSIHHGTEWPLCGELDIMETVNGLPAAHGTTHCGAGEKGGPCNEPIGRGASVALNDNGWHTWTLQVDRTNAEGGWKGEVIRWLVDGNVFHQVSGADIADEGIWATLAHSPMFMILNVAVGGSWPGDPNAATADSWGSMMEVEYVAVYST
ncbi:concanavalin A-like lectin/glucanase domain-containing protein [Chaetomium sp. MPI-CAGE-AT-0009]|nr:concanavalin A-like lectin/glucanase domain-containing protein [Chaetomium sp. MPI-CAGE-AT-0009]